MGWEEISLAQVPASSSQCWLCENFEREIVDLRTACSSVRAIRMSWVNSCALQIMPRSILK